MTAPVPDDVIEVRIRIGGPAGQGIKAAGQSLARVFMRAGYETFDLTEYPSLIKGGHNTYHLRVSDREIFSHVLDTDVLVALDPETVPLHAEELTPGAAVIYDPADFDDDTIAELPDGLCLIDVPLAQITQDVGGKRIMRNIVALGAVLGHIGFELSYLTDSIKQQFAHKPPEIAEQNIACATAGYEYAQEHGCAFPDEMNPITDRGDRILVDGNEAIGLGALAAGIGMYAAYPMTPASSLLHFMAKHGEDRGVIVKHTEDEIAAMNMVVGGAFGGARAMCGTSGGGFALMVEALGLAGVSESAVVVGLIQRPGPATGLPTWTEQSDLRFAIHASQGEFPRVVLAPGDRHDSFDLAWQAFNIADILQTPVIILGDAYLSDHRASVPPFETSRVRVDRGELQTEGEVTDYQRYKVTGSGISPRALPGVTGAEQIVNSYDHDEHGWASETSDMRRAQNEKRMRKMELAEAIVPRPQTFGPEEADMSLILFGSTKMPAREAMRMLAEEDRITVNIMQVVTVWPFPADDVKAFMRRAKATAVIEGNATGQLESLITEHCQGCVGHSLHRYDGRPFSPEQIRDFVRKVVADA